MTKSSLLQYYHNSDNKSLGSNTELLLTGSNWNLGINWPRFFQNCPNEMRAIWKNRGQFMSPNCILSQLISVLLTTIVHVFFSIFFLIFLIFCSSIFSTFLIFRYFFRFFWFFSIFSFFFNFWYISGQYRTMSGQYMTMTMIGQLWTKWISINLGINRCYRL